MLRDLLPAPFGSDRRARSARVADLPPYQVALWPDGWNLEGDGRVLVQDTHAMAEARRWYALADRNRSRDDGRRVMSLLGIFVPRAIVDLADRCFPSEQVASVAVQLIAGNWIAERRRLLLESPERTLAERSLAWQGSRHEPGMDGGRVQALVEGLIRTCVNERLIPDARYRVRVQCEGGYGIVAHRCVLDVGLDRYAADKVLEVLRAALVPWNRAATRDDGATLVLALALAARGRKGSL